MAVRTRGTVLLHMQCGCAESAMPHAQLCGLDHIECPPSAITHLQATVVFQEGVTSLLGGSKLPAGGLCGRSFKVQFAARNGAGYSAVATTIAAYAMPSCSVRGELRWTGGCWQQHTAQWEHIGKGEATRVHMRAPMPLGWGWHLPQRAPATGTRRPGVGGLMAVPDPIRDPPLPSHPQPAIRSATTSTASTAAPGITSASPAWPVAPNAFQRCAGEHCTGWLHRLDPAACGGSKTARECHAERSAMCQRSTLVPTCPPYSSTALTLSRNLPHRAAPSPLSCARRPSMLPRGACRPTAAAPV